MPDRSTGSASQVAWAALHGAAGIVVERPDGTVVDANPAACRMFGYDAATLVGRPYTVLCVPGERATQATLRAALVAGMRRSHVGRWHYARQDGTTVTADVITTRVSAESADAGRAADGDGGTHIVSVVHERLAVSSDDPVPDGAGAGERLESLGLLAGGIAHDFNNVLAVIRGNLELARDALDAPAPDVRSALVDLYAVEQATTRATALVRQLLAFGRMQARAPEPLDLSVVARDMLPLCRVALGPEIPLSLRLAAGLPRILADRTQLEQVLMNLVVNARDAVTEAQVIAPHAGDARRGVTVTTTLDELAPHAAARLGLAAGATYVRLAVRDTGIGMTDATRARIFEPFFTTKPVDRGTGLGLAATWGIVRQSGGAIDVDTRWQEGSTFSVYFPVAATPAAPAAPAAPPCSASTATRSTATASDREPALGSAFDERLVAASGSGGRRLVAVRADERVPRTILLAEDDHAVRRVAARLLRGAGYRVLEAGDGVDALALWRAHGGEVDLLLADIRMPRLRGDLLAEAVRRERPELPVILMTGFADDPSRGGAVSIDAAADRPLAKPFSGVELLERVAAALPALAGSPAGEISLGAVE